MKRQFNLGLGAVLGLFLVSCGGKPEATMTFPPADVSVMTVGAESVTLTTELPGRLNSMRDTQVRARANGILLKRRFVEGADVKEGDLLFEIDPAPMQAAYDNAKATLAKSEAMLKESRIKIDRYKELVAINAVSKQTFDEATAMLGQNEAEALATKAALDSAALNLGYTKVLAPTTGRIGKAMVTEGTLVSATEATLLAVIRQMDPIYFDFTQSSTDGLRLKKALAEGSLKGISVEQAKVTLILEDGSTYPEPGKLLFSDISVDPTTGMVTLRAEVPNPKGLLLPGMFARGQLTLAVNTNAVTVPQRTVTRGAGGAASVLVVGKDNKVEFRNIEVNTAVGNKWIVAKGLTVGEQIIVEGSQKAAPGGTVKPVPYVAATNAPAKAH